LSSGDAKPGEAEAKPFGGDESASKP